MKKTPWHLWVVAIAALLWNAAGAYTIMMAQAGRLSDLEPGERAYYAAQPVWFVVLTDISLVAAVLASVALLFRRKIAVWLYALSLASIVVTNAYEIAMRTSRVFASRAALVVTVIIAIIAVLQFLYARAVSTSPLLARARLSRSDG